MASESGKHFLWPSQVKNTIYFWCKTLTINEKPSITVWWWYDDISPRSSVTFPRNILNNLRYLEQVTISSSVYRSVITSTTFIRPTEKTNHHTNPVGLTPRIRSNGAMHCNVLKCVLIHIAVGFLSESTIKWDLTTGTHSCVTTLSKRLYFYLEIKSHH